MAVEFEWRFGDEIRGEGPPEEQPARRSRWRLWLCLILALVLVVGAGLYAWWRVRHQALARLEAEVQGVAELELRALAEGDTELYLSLQDSADPAWQEAQAAQAALGFLPPPAFALTTTTAFSVENARVVGDVARVEVVRSAGLPGEEMAPFRAVRFYRHSADGRWLHTRGDPDYGGEIVTLEGQGVEATAWAIDAEWMKPIVPEFEDLVERFCSLVACWGRAPLILDFTKPALFVIGAPDDEAARAVWKAALREAIVDGLIAREAGRAIDGPLGRGLFLARLREWMRGELGLRRPVSPDVDLIGEAVDAGEWLLLEELWHFGAADEGPRRPLAEAEIDLLLAFIEQEYGPAKTASLLPALGQSVSMEKVLAEALSQDWGGWLDFRHRYLRYVRNLGFELSADVAAFAEYDLVAPCGEPVNLWGLRLDRPEMRPLSHAGALDFILLSWSPDDARLLAWWFAPSVWEPRHTLDEDVLAILSQGKCLLEADGSGVRCLTSFPEYGLPVAWSPDGRYLAYLSYAPERHAEGFGAGLVDTETDQRVALDKDVPGWSGYGPVVVWLPTGWTLPCVPHPAWSPDGSKLAYLTSGGADPLIWLAESDGSKPRQVAEGSLIAWSPDGTQLALLDAESALKIHDLTTEETTTLVDGPALYDLLDLALESESALAGAEDLAWSPTGEWIAVGITQFDARKPVKGGVALIRPAGGETRVALTREAGVCLMGWSGDGRWLTSFIYGEGQEKTTVVGTDGELLLEAMRPVSWSPDGRFLALWGRLDHRLKILDVERGTWYSFDPAVRCESLVWQGAAWNPRGPLHEPAASARSAMPYLEWRSSVSQCDLPECQH